MADITVAVVNYNGKQILRRNLPALMAQQRVDFEVLVVDNGSTDGSLDLLNLEFPRARVIELNSNLGFAAAVNVAIGQSTARYFVVLNNDAAPEPDWLFELLSAAESSPEFGMFASRMVFAHDPTVINSAGIAVDLAGIAWDRLVGEKDAGEIREVFGPSGGAAMYRRELLNDVGGFDESFFAYLEDVDLAWRARLAGWRCLFVPTATVRHEHSATAVEGSPFKNYHLGRNKIWTILKNYPSPQILIYAPLILLYDVGAIPYTLLVRRDPAILLGRMAALLRLPAVLRQRRDIQGRRRVEWSTLRAQMDGFHSPWRLFDRYAKLRATLSGRPTT